MNILGPAPNANVVPGSSFVPGRREQKYPPPTHLYHQGRLSNVFLSWDGRCNLIVVPHQCVFKITEMYPIDIGHLFQEIYTLMEQKSVRNFTLHIYRRDWNVSPHLFLKVGMPQRAYETFTTGPLATLGYMAPIPPPPPIQRQHVPTGDSVMMTPERDE